MNDASKAYRWMEAGKQIGKKFTFLKEDKLYYASVAIQKCSGVYKFYYDEIEESLIPTQENHLLEIIVDVQDFEQLPLLVHQKTGFQLDILTPLKGQRVFNPSFY